VLPAKGFGDGLEIVLEGKEKGKEKERKRKGDAVEWH
jgi:hypothetical protein